MNGQPNNRGTTLVEMVLLLTVISVVLVLTLQLLKRTIQVQQACVQEVAGLRIRDALSQRLRLDIASANHARVDDQQQLRLTSAGGLEVLYRLSETGWIYREVHRASMLTARDRWQLEGISRWSISLDSPSAGGESHDVVRISFSKSEASSWPAFRILACVDSSRAFLARATAEITP